MVAHIPLLEYSIYDIHIDIINRGDIVENSLASVHFKMAYIDEHFTNIHLGVRITFFIVSLVIGLIYLCKMCRIKRTIFKTYD
jgi:hypothetical protein